MYPCAIKNGDYTKQKISFRQNIEFLIVYNKKSLLRFLCGISKRIYIDIIKVLLFFHCK